jgi:hypothetical protein
VVRGHHLAGQGATELIGRPGDTEIGQGRAESRAENIRGFDVAMDDPGLVGGVERLADLDAYLEYVVDGEWSAVAEDLRVGAALAVLHHDVRAIIVGHAGVDDRDDVWLAGQGDRGGELAGRVDRHRSRVGRDHLDRHVPVQPGLEGTEDEGRGAVRDQLRVVVSRQRG